MLYESIANSIVESANADKETLAYVIVIDAITDANDRNETRKILTQCVEGRISNPDAEERLISFISRIHKDAELDPMSVNTLDLSKEFFALNGQLKTTTSQLDKYKSQSRNHKSRVWTASIIAIASFVSAGASIGFAIKANNSLAQTKTAMGNLSNKYSDLNNKHEALNKELAAFQLQNQELSKGNEELKKAFEPTKQENERLAAQSQAAENKNEQLNDRLSRACKLKRNLFFNKECN
jgi:chromosome segregation ATPase